MKPVYVILASLILIATCSKRFDPDVNKGLVSFRSFPGYKDGKISFSAQIQLPVSGNPVDIEYKIFDRYQILDSGKLTSRTSDMDENV